MELGRRSVECFDCMEEGLEAAIWGYRYKSRGYLSHHLECCLLILLTGKLRPRKVTGHAVWPKCKWWVMNPVLPSPGSVLIPLQDPESHLASLRWPESMESLGWHLEMLTSRSTHCWFYWTVSVIHLHWSSWTSGSHWILHWNCWIASEVLKTCGRDESFNFVWLNGLKSQYLWEAIFKEKLLLVLPYSYD